MFTCAVLSLHLKGKLKTKAVHFPEHLAQDKAQQTHLRNTCRYRWAALTSPLYLSFLCNIKGFGRKRSKGSPSSMILHTTGHCSSRAPCPKASYIFPAKPKSLYSHRASKVTYSPANLSKFM